MRSAELPRPHVRGLYYQRGVFFVLLLTLRAPRRTCRSSATCSTLIHELPRFFYFLIVRIQKSSHLEVRSIAILQHIHNVKRRAYVLGGWICPHARWNDSCTVTSSVDTLDLSLNQWQSSPPPLVGADAGFQIATMDHKLGACSRTNNIVNERFF